MSEVIQLKLNESKKIKDDIIIEGLRLLEISDFIKNVKDDLTTNGLTSREIIALLSEIFKRYIKQLRIVNKKVKKAPKVAL